MDVEKVLNDNIFKIWTKFVLASVVGVVLNTIYGLVDGIFVGRGVGEAGLASVNIAWPAVTIIIGVGLMIGMGTSSLIAIHMGKGDKDKAEETLGTAIKSIILIGSFIMLLGFIFREPILNLLGATEDTIDYVRDYYTVIYLITIPYIFAIALNPIVRTDGRPDLSMIMIGVGAIANIFLDWLLVIKIGLGVKGAAIATSASIFISMIVSLFYFIKGNSKVKIKKEFFKIEKGILREILKIGFVSFGIQLSYGIIIFVQNNVIYMYGNTADVAIYTVSTYINCVLVNTFMGVSQGVQPLIGYHYGADKFNRMKKLIYITLGASILGGILIYAGLILYGKDLVVTFGVSLDNVDFAYKAVLIYCLGTPIIGIIFTMSAYYQSIGKNSYANLLSIGRGFVFQFIFTLILPPMIGVIGVFVSLPLAEVITLIVLMIVLLIEKNKNSKVIN